MNKIAFFVILSLVALMAGCSTETSESQGRTSPFIGGIEGIQMDFLEGSPPLEVSDAGKFPFDVTVRLQNAGEADVEPNKVLVSLSGIDSSDIGGERVKNSVEKLMGTHKDQEGNPIEGTTTYLTFSGFNYNKVLAGNTQLPLWANLCYTYYTKSSVILCVKKEMTKASEDTICQASGIKAVYNSGSPIQIEEFRQAAAGEKSISFSFTVAHKGTGSVYSPSASDCEGGYPVENRVRLTVDTGIGSGPMCSGLNGNTGEIILPQSGKRPIVCTQDISSADAAFEKPITITTDFNYKQHKTVSLLIKHT